MDNGKCIYINTISGGIVNFGGAIKIAPISITKNSGSSTSPATTTAPSALGTVPLTALGSALPS